MPKIAITGKGGVGKTTLAALLAYIYARDGHPVIAIDADPAASLAYALGMPADLAAQVSPIAELEDLIYERTGAKPGTTGGFFKLNPRVDDIPDRFSVLYRGIRLLQLETISSGGTGCICPESALLKTLVTYLVLYRNEVMILDMEAGVEHLGRATADAICFNNTAGVLTDDPALRQSLLDFVSSGKGFAGFHAAAATFVQYPKYDQFPAFGEMIGGYENGGVRRDDRG